MDESPRRKPERSAGAFLGPTGTFPAAMHTLSDEIPSEPDEIETERRGPPPPERPPEGLREHTRRLFGRPRP